jgi:S1-C subfamily serine protease
MNQTKCIAIFFGLLFNISHVLANDLVELIKKNKPSVVGIGLYTPLDSNASQLRGTGFIFGDGKHIATNYHVVAEPLDPAIVQHYVAMIGQGEQPKVLKAEVLAMDPVHDIAILRIEQTFPALSLAADELLFEGTEIAFTGFPIGAVLGLYPATHKGIVAAIAPDAIPSRNADQLTLDMLSRLKKPFMIYQLDATAYPGNSGSPVFDIDSSQVIAVINKVFVAQGKEAALTNPSGISYAIPIKYLKQLASKHNIRY